jgi:hypothetical protein
MPRPNDEVEELRALTPGAMAMPEGGVEYFLLPGIKVPGLAGLVDALLCPQQHSGYTTRLFLSSVVPGKGQNWRPHTILSRQWHACSWNDVPANQRLAEILAQHLRAFR